MATAASVISLEDYLSHTYEPDCDYVDGHLEERNLGEWDHSRLQLRLGAYLLAQYGRQGIEVVTEQRVRVEPRRYRITDLCVVLGKPGEQILTKPPFLCIEILSPEDRMRRVKIRIADYLAMGVPYVWVLDPQTRQAYVATTAKALREVKSGILRTENPVLEGPLAEVFA